MNSFVAPQKSLVDSCAFVGTEKGDEMSAAVRTAHRVTLRPATKAFLLISWKGKRLKWYAPPTGYAVNERYN